jgi:hypothetical protein
MSDKTTHRLSPKAQAELAYATEYVARYGYIWAGARPQYEAGTYHDAVLTELLNAGAIEPHADPTKGYIVKW